MVTRWLLTALATLALTALPLDAQRWWEEAESTSPLDEITIERDGARRVNWVDGYLEVAAEGTCDPSISVSQAHCRSLALKTARALAYEKLAETVYGINIDAENSYRDRVLQNARLRTETHGLIRGARVVDESHELMPDGSVLARVRLGLLLAGPKGLSSVAIPYVLDNTDELRRGAVRAELEDLRRTLGAEIENAKVLLDSIGATREALAREPGEEPAWKAVEEAIEAADAAKRALAAAERAEARAQQAAKSAEEVSGRTAGLDEELVDHLREAQDAAREATSKAEEVRMRAEELEATADAARLAAEQTSESAHQVAEALTEVREAKQAMSVAQEKASEVAEYAKSLESALPGSVQAEAAPEVTAALREAARRAERARAVADSLAEVSRQALARAEQIRREVVERGEASASALQEARDAKEAALRARQEIEGIMASARQNYERGASASRQARAAAASAEGAITGVILDASGVGARPALAPKILTPDGEEVYGPSRVPRDVVMNVGLVAYANSVSRAKEIEDRVGGNPLVIEAISTGGSNKANLVISDEDAKLLASLDERGSLREQCAWCVVLS
jgi:hypothetical protein